MSREIIPFTKMQGCGNDYIYIDGARVHIPVQDKPALVRRLSDRHYGIGGDGVIFINPAPASETDVDFEMEMYNADGSRSEMCGNGIRCVGAYVYEKGLTDKKELTVISAGAKKYLTLETDTQTRRVTSVTVDMGAPVLDPAKIPVTPALADGRTEKPAQSLDSQPAQAEGMTILNLRIQAESDETWRTSCVSMGNPHAVVVLAEDAELARFPIEEIGPRFENHPAFPNRTNTEFVRVLNRTEVEMRVWERGTGETLACGTGCCALTVACVLQGLTEEEITVHVSGGEIRCRYDKKAGRVFMTGPAVTVFEGEIER